MAEVQLCHFVINTNIRIATTLTTSTTITTATAMLPFWGSLLCARNYTLPFTYMVQFYLLIRSILYVKYSFLYAIDAKPSSI